MLNTPDLKRYLQLAFELAGLGRGQVEPNPRVGCVALRGGRVVGRGYHAVYGGPHAEVSCLADAHAAGAHPDEIIVTLEPCSTEGKTPACVGGILKNKISRVYVGATDPNPLHAGRGISILKNHGVDVVHCHADDRFREENRPFIKFLGYRRPFVIAKWAMTLDGRFSLSNGDSKWISCERSRAFVHQLRGRCEGVVVGVSTILRDDPLLTCRDQLLLKQPPARVIFDSALRTPPTATVVVNREAPTMILTLPTSVQSAPDAAERRRALAAAGVELIDIPPAAGSSTGQPRLDVALALEYLYSRGMRRILLESGPELLGAMRAARCVDQVIAFVAPKIAGAGAVAAAPAGPPEAARMDDSDTLEDIYVDRIHHDVLIGGFLNIQSIRLPPDL